MELIKTNKDGRQVVSARELHSFLGVKKHFTEWMKDQLDWFKNDVDYQAVHLQVNAENGIGHSTKVDYALTIETSKHIAMMSKVKKGKEVRDYFIECEKSLKAAPVKLPTIKELAQMLITSEEDKERLQVINDLQTLSLKEAQPKVKYHDEVLSSTGTYNTNIIAKELGMSAITLNKILKEKGVQYFQNGTWVLKHDYQDKGFTKTKTFTYTSSQGETKTSMQTVWCEKGRMFIHSLLKS